MRASIPERARGDGALCRAGHDRGAAAGAGPGSGQGRARLHQSVRRDVPQGPLRPAAQARASPPASRASARWSLPAPRRGGLIGKRVAFATGLSGWGSWARIRASPKPAPAIPLMDGVRDEDAAAMIVNPLTALAMFGIVKDEGEKAFVVTAGASQLCKLMIARRARTRATAPSPSCAATTRSSCLKAIGAAHVLNAESAGFRPAARRGAGRGKAAHLPRRGHRAARRRDLPRDGQARALDHLWPARSGDDADHRTRPDDLHAQEDRGLLADRMDAHGRRTTSAWRPSSRRKSALPTGAGRRT